MKKTISILCILAMLLAAFSMLTVSAAEAPAGASKWDGTIPAADKNYSFSGSGTEADPWLIQSAAELALFAANVRLNEKETTYGGKFFKLTVDIDIDNKGWRAIGGSHPRTDGLSTQETDDNRFSYFAGTFDGDYHKIYNFALADSVEVKNAETGATEKQVLHQQGLFGVLMGGTIKNVGIESGNITVASSNRTGALLGVLRCGGLVENCYNKASVTFTNLTISAAYVGALIGQVIDAWNISNNTEQLTKGVYKDKAIINCYNTGDLTVTLKQTGKHQFRIGGIVGQYVGGTPVLKNVYNVANITMINSTAATEDNSNNNHRLGGITGAQMDSGNVRDVYFKGTISYTETYNISANTLQIGFFAGNVSANTVFVVDEATEKPLSGYCPVGTCDAEKAIASLSQEDNDKKCVKVDDVVIPLAQGSDFIVDDVKQENPPQGDDQNPPQGDDQNPPQGNDQNPPQGGDSTEQSIEPVTTGKPGTDTPATGDEEKKGCSSSIGIGSILLIAGIASGSAVFVSRRKKENE